jgi:hypothetical protein
MAVNPVDETKPPGGGATGTASPIYPEGRIDPGMGPLIDMAIADLASRLGVATGDIDPVAAVLVTWPDSSMGCPRPGMSYLQVLQDGSVIELRHADRFYRYHSGGRLMPFLCDQPLADPPPPIGS